MKRLFLWTVVVLTVISMMSLLSLVGCKKEAAEETAAEEVTTVETSAEETVPAEEEITTEPVTITVWVIAGQETDVWKKVGEMYNAEHPNVTIEVVTNEYQNQRDVVPSALATPGTDVDIIWYPGGGMTDTFAKEGLLLDLTPYEEEYGWYDQMYDGARGYEVPDLGTFFLSTDLVFGDLIYYNKDIFEEVGVEPPTTDLEELFTLAAKLKEAGYEPLSGTASKDPYYLGYVLSQLLPRFLGKDDTNKLLYWERDPNKSAETAEIIRSEGVIEAYDFLKRMSKDVFAEGIAAFDYQAGHALFDQGKAAMYAYGSWEFSSIPASNPDLNFDYFLFPPHNGDSTMIATYSNGIMCPAYVSEEKIPVIVDIINSLLTAEYAKECIFGVGLVSSSTNVSNEELQGLIPEGLSRAISDLNKNGSVDVIDVWVSPARTKTLNDSYIGIVEGDWTPEEAAQYIYDAALEELE